MNHTPSPHRLEFQISDPTADDASALVTEFFAEIAARYPGFDPSRQPAAPSEAFTLEQGGAFLIVLSDGKPVGCAGLQRLDETTAEVRRVFVRTTARGGGAARALLTTLLETARDLGYERVRLDTGDRLPEARGLFLAFGFRDMDDYNGNPYAAYWMELPLVSELELRPGDA